MNKHYNCALGLISIIILSVLNVLLTLPLFMTMLVEQIRIGAGTALEMGTFIIWAFELMCFFPFTVALFFTGVSIYKKDYIHKIVINIVQIVLYLTLNILSIIWMFI